MFKNNIKIASRVEITETENISIRISKICFIHFFFYCNTNLNS